MEILLAPPLAFIIYLIAVGGLALIGKAMAGTPHSSPLKTSTYASGNAPGRESVPGYRAFFVIALFFAALHLGALMIGSSDLSPAAALYVVGLVVTLLALLIG